MDKQTERLAVELRKCAELLEHFHDALSGGGKLTAQSIGAPGKTFKTLARDYAASARKALAQADQAK